jgi:hypothetical protein
MASWKGESQRDAGIVQLSATESFKAVRLIAEKRADLKIGHYIRGGEGLLVFVNGYELYDFESFSAGWRGDLDFIADLAI